MVCINVWERLDIEQKGITTMQDTNWNQIEWELLSEATEIAPPWKDGHFFNTFNLDMDGIRQIRIWRDEEYMLRAEASGQYKKREGGEEPEPGVVERSTLKGWWNHSYEAKLIQCIPENTTTNYLLQEERAEVACKMSVCKIKVKPAKGVPKQERVSLVEWCINARGLYGTLCGIHGAQGEDEALQKARSQRGYLPAAQGGGVFEGYRVYHFRGDWVLHQPGIEEI